MDQLPRLGKRELICLLLFTCNYVVFVCRSFLFLWVLGMDYVILLWHSLSLPYNYFAYQIGNFVRYLYAFLNTMWHITLAINCTKNLFIILGYVQPGTESVYKQATDLNEINENR